MPAAHPHVLWFKHIDKHDGHLVGGKGANLGEMLRAGFPVPDGFVVTAQAYFSFIDHNKLRNAIYDELHHLDVNDSQKLQAAAKRVQNLILKAKMPADIRTAIEEAYAQLGKTTPVAIRSSATAEDLPDASFAGQQETFLNIRGTAGVVLHVQKAWASLFQARAIFYRVQKGYDHFRVGLAAPVQRMVQSDVSGVMFSINPVTNDKQTVVIEAIWGLGENIVQGTVTPDHYEVEKGSWDILKTQIIPQKVEMVRRWGATKNYAVPRSRQKKRKLSDAQVIALAKYAVKLQQHYLFPQDSEWAIENGQIFIVQTRPITTMQAVEKKSVTVDASALTSGLKRLLSGEPASPGLISGSVRQIHSPSEIYKLKVGEIMVTRMTTPDFVPAMKKAGGLVTDQGGQTSHAAIVSRELGLPCIVGTNKATSTLKDGQVVTLNAATGEVFAGGVDPEALERLKQQTSHAHEAGAKLETKTKVYVNLAEPELASTIAHRNVDGVGLLRAEFMIAQLGYHPKKLIADGKQRVFVNQLAKGMSTFCEAFGERPVVYRATDFKTNEYRHLVGGERYEPQEENPMIGYRGCYRYISDEKVFALELEAIKKVRQKHQNLWLMIPFVRSVADYKRVKTLVYQAGLRRSSTFKLWMMVEIPENVIMIDEYIDAGVDGFSIGTNDLTMLMLGTDRDNEHVASRYDEMHPAVLWALERAVTKAHARGVRISVCGQAPSNHYELAELLVRWGVTSVSVTPDAIEAIREHIATAEKKLRR